MRGPVPAPVRRRALVAAVAGHRPTTTRRASAGARARRDRTSARRPPHQRGDGVRAGRRSLRGPRSRCRRPRPARSSPRPRRRSSEDAVVVELGAGLLLRPSRSPDRVGHERVEVEGVGGGADARGGIRAREPRGTGARGRADGARAPPRRRAGAAIEAVGAQDTGRAREPVRPHLQPIAKRFSEISRATTMPDYAAIIIISGIAPLGDDRRPPTRSRRRASSGPVEGTSLPVLALVGERAAGAAALLGRLLRPVRERRVPAPRPGSTSRTSRAGSRPGRRGARGRGGGSRGRGGGGGAAAPPPTAAAEARYCASTRRGRRSIASRGRHPDRRTRRERRGGAPPRVRLPDRARRRRGRRERPRGAPAGDGWTARVERWR